MSNELFTLIHFSDPHFISRTAVHPWKLCNKRLIGWLNLRFNRAGLHKIEMAHSAFSAAARLAPDHVVITGDIGNLSLAGEYAAARAALPRLGVGQRDITVVPGNHDAYIPAAWPRGPFWRDFEPYCRSDDLPATDNACDEGSRFPIVRWLGGKQKPAVALIGCSSARPAPPLVAWGALGAPQRRAMQRLLRKAKKRGCHTVVALHHPVQPGVTRWDNGLKDRMEVVHVLEQEGPELVLHGHMHRPMEAVLFGSSRSIRVLGTGSASLDEPRTERRAQFRVLRFGTEGLEENTLYVHNDTRDVFEPLDP